MKLTELDPEFVKRLDDNNWRRAESLAEADGVQFLCPKCMLERPDGIGVHSVICWAPHVPQTTEPKPGRWNLVGTSLEDLSLVGGSSSVLITSGCHAHFFVRNGAIEMCS